MTTTIDLDSLPDYRWLANGQSVLSGRLAALLEALDRLFLAWAEQAGAEPYLFPAFISAAELGRLDYFRSFPHLVTFPVALSCEEGNIERFLAGEPLSPEGTLLLPDISPVHDVLTPAACYHFYSHFQSRRLERPLYLTTRATCFRRESHYEPLRRQWSFAMREIVCIGTAGEASDFLERFRASLSGFFRDIDLPVSWQTATDPFFKPSRSPRYLMQKVDPVKTEAVFGDRLAISSTNLHRDYFGEAFDIIRGDGAASSACVAFGLERWLYAILARFGADEAGWPEVIRRELHCG